MFFLNTSLYLEKKNKRYIYISNISRDSQLIISIISELEHIFLVDARICVDAPFFKQYLSGKKK